MLKVGTHVRRKTDSVYWPGVLGWVMDRTITGNYLVFMLEGIDSGVTRLWSPEYFDVEITPEPDWEV